MAKTLAPGKMYRPTAMEINSADDTLYVVEQYNHRVSKWNYTAGLFDFTLDPTWGSNGNGTTGNPGRPTADDDTNLNFPTGIAQNAPSDFLFVSDTLNHRIRVLLKSTGEFVDSIGSPGRGDGQLYRPAHLDDNDATGDLAIADSANHRISVFENSGAFNFTGIATPPAEGFHTPWGVKHNTTNSEFYYSDVIRGKMYSYDDTGLIPSTPISFGTPGTDTKDPNQLFYPGSSNGSTPTSGSSWLSDTRNNEIKEYTDLGQIAQKIAGAGTGDGQLYWPQHTTGFSNGGTGYLCVCNTLNNRIEVYERVFGGFETNFGSP
ncbi:MAG: NHL repeat-containing protein [Candidatus Aenigmarchaeota archaeon]|nr:NHL repeat-containing protein [Candidatus Aenigmarchaeota archaeon]